jgi:hypothetical protein
MCTVTFIARRSGYAVGMNRDEKRTRVAGRPPELRRIHDRSMIHPSEPGGGTWIAVNDSGATLALINWYSISTDVEGRAMSRGEIVRAACIASSVTEVESILTRLPLNRINPFRLIGIFPGRHEIGEWQSDSKQLVQQRHWWQSQQWISSGYDEPTAQAIRGRTFQRAKQQASAGRLDWLRRLHRSHTPALGPFSTCMHRGDAATVSYTEVSVSAQQVVMHHSDGAPCQCGGPEPQLSSTSLPRKPGTRPARGWR